MWPFKSKPKCAHDWNVKGTTVARPYGGPFEYSGFHGGEYIRELTQGKTRFLCTCSKCGKVETHYVYGVEAEEKR